MDVSGQVEMISLYPKTPKTNNNIEILKIFDK